MQCPPNPKSPQPSSRGFTLVELLVVIAIIGVLVALLLPAVQQARESSRRTACQSNLKQLALALHNYHDTHLVLPPAGADYGWCKYPALYGPKEVKNLNGWVLVLPFLEQSGLHSQLDFNQTLANVTTGNDGCCPPTTALVPLTGDAVTSGNADLITKRLPFFTCPSDAGNPYLPDGGVYGIKSGSKKLAAKTNYDFSTGNSFDCDAWRRQTTRTVFGENSNTRFSDINDGTSQTAFVVETLYEVYNGRCNAWGFRGWVMVGVDVGNHRINRWDYLPYAPFKRGRLGSWAHPGSMHASGCQLARADGSVGFIREEVGTVIKQRLSTMNDGQSFELP